MNDAPIKVLNEPSAVDKAVTDVGPDEMTPRQALDFLYTLKRLQQESD